MNFCQPDIDYVEKFRKISNHPHTGGYDNRSGEKTSVNCSNGNCKSQFSKYNTGGKTTSGGSTEPADGVSTSSFFNGSYGGTLIAVK